MPRNVFTADFSQQELVRRVLWYIRIRWLYLLVLGGSAIGAQYLTGGLSTEVLRNTFIISGAMLINGIFYVLAQQKHTNRPYFIALALAQLLLDIVLFSFAIYLHRGFESQLVILYGLPIVVGGALFGYLAAYLSAAFSVGGYSLAILLEWRERPFEPLALVPTPENFVINWIFFSIVLVLLAIITSYMARQIRVHEEELAREEVISLISHQLRTPATAIKNILSTLLDNYAGNITADQRALLRKAYDENERELHLVSTMLDVAHAGNQQFELQPEPVDVGALIRRTAETMQSSLSDRGQKLIINTPDKLAWYLDSQKIYMVLDNLINNASKYSPPDTTITVTGRLNKKGNRLRLAVKDEGEGIDREDTQRIFDKHVRLNNPTTLAVTGSGLGLYLTKHFVDLHRGIISVNSEPGKGTEFVVVIPRLKPTKQRLVKRSENSVQSKNSDS